MRLIEQEDINFLLTNRIPRRLATQFIGWFSRIEQPLVRDLSIAVWRLFADLDLREAKTDAIPQPARLLHPGTERRRARDRCPCRYPGQPLRRHRRRLRRDRRHRSFIRPRAFPTRSKICSAIAISSKVPRRALRDVTADVEHVSPLPRAARLPGRGSHLHLRRHLERQSDRAQARRAPVLQERARRRADDAQGRRSDRDAGGGGRDPGRQHPSALPRRPTQSRHRGPNVIPCDAKYRKGDELGWFEHGSTIIVFAPEGFALADNVRDGATVRVGEPLMRLPGSYPVGSRA